MDKFDFGSHKNIEISVVGPDGKSYILREAFGDAVAQFNNARGRCMRFEDGGVSSVDGQGNLELYLVSLCLFNVKEDGSPNLESNVSRGVLGRWPARVIKPLFDKSKEISEIDMDDNLESLRKQYKELGERIRKMEEDAAKNEPNSTEIG